MARRSALGMGILLAGLCLCSVARAEDLVWATGRIMGADGKPLRGALIAVYDDKNKVVDYAKTDDNGDYALAVPSSVLHLGKKSKGFFTQVFGGVTRFVGGTAEFVASPLRAGVRAVTSAQAGLNIDPLSRGGITAGGALVDQVLGMATPRRRPNILEERKMPGVLLIKAVSPGTKDLVGLARVYWVQQEKYRAGGKETQNLAAWLDPVHLEEIDSEKPSTVGSALLTFTKARLEPSLVEHGQTVRIMAKIASPTDPPVNAVVVARNNRTGEKWELEAQGNGVYSGSFEVSKRFPLHDQTISLVAYAAKENTPGRRKEVERAIEGAGLWNPDKPFVYNPLLVVSRSRADLLLTVIAPDKTQRRN